ncbi:hypothetical protein [Asticcacaulis sp. YBE204]|uniref:hypothetical protein n=1 Tax=Asticcacaulis sp. YBE204 TaxID=1282363 RepID=UPI0012DC6C6D|nr:hypothetical protein [Asticcacaulis sp. YBE204]
MRLKVISALLAGAMMLAGCEPQFDPQGRITNVEEDADLNATFVTATVLPDTEAERQLSESVAIIAYVVRRQRDSTALAVDVNDPSVADTPFLWVNYKAGPRQGSTDAALLNEADMIGFSHKGRSAFLSWCNNRLNETREICGRALQTPASGK